MSEPLHHERWARVEALFLEASDLPPAERDPFLARACGDDDALRAELESLLAAAADGMTERIEAVDRVAEDLMTSTGAAAVGRSLGPYRLEEEIGRGGMGVVYRAVRVDGDFEQTVAVKVLPGALFSPEAMGRFQNERRILASLEHPNIARLLDGGTTPEGVPYVIMEYVDGIPLDRHAGEKGLTVEGRVWLFLAVCEAVQYAHRNLVVHRDLKPSNILVTADGTPKLLDFGIAKLLEDGDPTAGGAAAPTVTRILTPRFASPEQLLGKRIGTPSDVYTLGLVLYRLLAGVDAQGAGHSWERVGGRWKRASADAALDPFDPVLRALEDAFVPPSVASDDPHLHGRLRGDLDTIVLKALRRDPAERYDTVRALADDLERYLTGKPITARPPTFGYRARKFVTRNRGAVLGAAAAVVLLATQTGVFLSRLAEERDVARREADRAARTLDFLTGVFRRADPFVSADPELTALEILGQGTARVEDELADQPAVQAEILDAVGTVYGNLGALDSARSAFQRSLAVREATFGPDAPETALGASHLAGLLIELDELDAADSLLSRSLSIRRTVLPPNHPDVAEDIGRRADLADRAGRFPLADSLFREALTVMESPSEPRDALRGTLLSNYGALLVDMGRLEEADTVLRDALSVRRDLYGERHPEVAVTLHHLARLRLNDGAYAEAETLYSELLAWGAELLGEEHTMVVTWRNNLAAVLKGLARYEEALEIQEGVLDRWRALYGREHGLVALALNNVANLQAELGRLDEANAALEEALAINRSLYGDEHPDVATNLNNLATMAWRRGDFAEAASMQEEVLALDRALLGPDHEYVATDLTGLGNYRLYLGQLDRAEGPLLEGLELMRRIRGDDNVTTANALASYADWLVAVGRGEDAEALARESLEIRLGTFPDDDYWVALSRSTLGAALTLQGRYAEAETELVLAGEIMSASVPEGDPTRVRNEERLAALHETREGS